MEYRGYDILPLNNMIGFEIKYIGKGSAHSSLRGMFTSKHDARKLIDLYLGKEEVDGEADTSSRSEQIQRRPYHRRKSPNNAG